MALEAYKPSLSIDPAMPRGQEEGYSSGSDWYEPETLFHKINNLGIPSKFPPSSDDRTFFPSGRVDRLVTADVIQGELGISSISGGRGVGDDDDVARWVCTEAQRVYQLHILAEIERKHDLRRSLERFREYGVNDRELFRNIYVLDAAASSTKPDYMHAKIWRMECQRKVFFASFWKLWAPVFQKDKVDYWFHRKSVWPIVECSTEVILGKFSRVYRARIHKDHQTHGYEEVAIKEITFDNTVRSRWGEKEWDLEARNLYLTNSINHEHIVKFLAAIRQEESRYFMFPWANGGNLADFWRSTATQDPDRTTIRHSIEQLRGLVDALCRLHNFVPPLSGESSDSDEAVVTADEQPVAGDESLRHGDLKPENILRFLSNEASIDTQNRTVGVLKIADMGHAKRHHIKTAYRKVRTTARFTTILYEAPEAMTCKLGRSRLYDIWSIGCITFELILWLLYGSDMLDELCKEMGVFEEQNVRFFEIDTMGNGDKKARVHPVVQRWIEHMQANDPECKKGTAIGDLLDVVITKLLVVDLPPHVLSAEKGVVRSPVTQLASPKPREGGHKHYRTTAKEFRDLLGEIISHFDDDGYLLTGASRLAVRPPNEPTACTFSVGHIMSSTSSQSSWSEGSSVLSPGDDFSREYHTDYSPLLPWKSGISGGP